MALFEDVIKILNDNSKLSVVETTIEDFIQQGIGYELITDAEGNRMEIGRRGTVYVAPIKGAYSIGEINNFFKTLSEETLGFFPKYKTGVKDKYESKRIHNLSNHDEELIYFPFIDLINQVGMAVDHYYKQIDDIDLLRSAHKGEGANNNKVCDWTHKNPIMETVRIYMLPDVQSAKDASSGKLGPAVFTLTSSQLQEYKINVQ